MRICLCASFRHSVPELLPPNEIRSRPDAIARFLMRDMLAVALATMALCAMDGEP